MGIYINNNGTIERKDGAPGPAGSIAYDNTESGLVSSNVQNAIDEVNERVIENISDNASIELTATAAHAHAVGTSFMLIGQLVKTTSAIAVGDTIAVGTNVEPTSVLDLLGDVNTAISALNSKYVTQFIVYPNKVTAPANLVFDVNVSCVLSGYSLVGITGWRIGSGGHHVGVVSCLQTNTTNVLIRLINNGSEAREGIDITISALFVRN